MGLLFGNSYSKDQMKLDAHQMITLFGIGRILNIPPEDFGKMMAQEVENMKYGLDVMKGFINEHKLSEARKDGSVT